MRDKVPGTWTSCPSGIYQAILQLCAGSRAPSGKRGVCDASGLGCVVERSDAGRKQKEQACLEVRLEELLVSEQRLQDSEGSGVE